MSIEEFVKEFVYGIRNGVKEGKLYINYDRLYHGTNIVASREKKYGVDIIINSDLKKVDFYGGSLNTIAPMIINAFKKINDKNIIYIRFADFDYINIEFDKLWENVEKRDSFLCNLVRRGESENTIKRVKNDIKKLLLNIKILRVVMKNIKEARHEKKKERVYVGLDMARNERDIVCSTEYAIGRGNIVEIMR